MQILKHLRAHFLVGHSAGTLMFRTATPQAAKRQQHLVTLLKQRSVGGRTDRGAARGFDLPWVDWAACAHCGSRATRTSAMASGEIRVRDAMIDRLVGWGVAIREKTERRAL